MKIVVIGTINLDTIELPHGGIENSYGGLLYSILPLALLTDQAMDIIPVVNLGQDVERPIREILSRYPRIAQEGIHVVPEKNNHVYLRYTSDSEREEVQVGGLPPVTFDQVAPFLDADVILINFISGRDLSLETFSLLRTHSKGAVYTDLHSLSLGIDARGQRFLRPLPQWERWVGQANTIQMNRAEARSISRSRLDTDDELLSFGHTVMQAGPSVLLITMGAGGSVLLTTSDRGTCLERFPAYRPARIMDTTGCGDVFLAAFVAVHTRTGDSVRASRFANLVAGTKCQLAGIGEIEGLRELAPWG